MTRLPAELEALRQIDFSQVVVSATLGVNGTVGPVNAQGMAAKVAAVAEPRRSGRPVCALGVADEQPKAAHLPGGCECVAGKTLPELAERLAHASNDERRFGRRPDVDALLRGHYREDFTGRTWLRRRIHDFIAAHDGGLYVLVADPGFGKTAFCLDLVRRARTDRLAEDGLPDLVGWAFARRASRPLSDDPAEVLAQLEREARYRCNLPRQSGGKVVPVPQRLGDAAREFGDFLHALGRHCEASDRQALLLIDGCDEAFQRERLDSLLPRRWPKGVYLILAGRSPGLATNALYPLPERPLERLSCHAADAGADWRADNDRDLREYVARRATEIRAQHREELLLPSALQEAILAAAEGHFFVASGLLLPRASLVGDLRAWAADRTRLPHGVDGYIRQQLDRVVAGVQKEFPRTSPHKLEQATRALLGLVALTPSALEAPDDLLALHDIWKDSISKSRARTPMPGYTELAAPRVVGGLDTTALDRKRILAILAQAGALDLFASHGGGVHQLAFWHTRMREVALALACESLGHPQDEAVQANVRRALHGLLAAGCARWRDFGQRPRLHTYALRHGPLHAALSSARDTAADWLMDFTPAGDGYLDTLWREMPQEAWPALAPAIAATLTGKAGVLDTDRSLQLQALQRALAAHQPFLARGEVPLVQALYNRMAGYWSDTTALGHRLRTSAIACRRPWIEKLNLDPADALGPLEHRLGAGVNCMAMTPEGEYLAAGLFNGEVWLWTREELMAGLPGRVAIRHDARVPVLALLATDQAQGGFVMASACGRVVQIQHGAAALASQVDGARVAIQHNGSVRAIALLATDQAEGGFVIASAGWDRVVRLQQGAAALAGRTSDANVAIKHAEPVTALSLLATDHAEGSFVIASASEDGVVLIQQGAAALAGRTRDARMAIKHADPVTALAMLATDAAQGGFVLASAGQYVGIVQVQSAEAALLGEARSAQVAIRHDGSVNCIALLASDRAHGGFVLASAGDDGVVQIQHGAAALAGRTSDAKVAIKHAVGVSALALLTPVDGGFVVTSAGVDGTVQVRRAAAAMAGEAQAAHVAIQHDYRVTAVKLLNTDQGQGGFVIASAGHDRVVRVLHSAAAFAGSADHQQVAIRHYSWVTAVALLATDKAKGGFVLASGGGNLVRVQQGAAALAGQADPFQVAIHHETWVKALALLAIDKAQGGFVVASASDYGEVRVQQGAAALAGRTSDAKTSIKHAPPLTALAFLTTSAADGGFVLATAGRRVVQIQQGAAALEGRTGDAKVAIRHPGQVFALALLSTDETWGGFVLASASGRAVQVRTGAAALAKKTTATQAAIRHHNRVLAIALVAAGAADEGFVLASADYDGVVQVQHGAAALLGNSDAARVALQCDEKYGCPSKITFGTSPSGRNRMIILQFAALQVTDMPNCDSVSRPLAHVLARGRPGDVLANFRGNPDDMLVAIASGNCVLLEHLRLHNMPA